MDKEFKKNLFEQETQLIPKYSIKHLLKRKSTSDLTSIQSPKFQYSKQQFYEDEQFSAHKNYRGFVEYTRYEKFRYSEKCPSCSCNCSVESSSDTSNLETSSSESNSSNKTIKYRNRKKLNRNSRQIPLNCLSPKLYQILEREEEQRDKAVSLQQYFSLSILITFLRFTFFTHRIANKLVTRNSLRRLTAVFFTLFSTCLIIAASNFILKIAIFRLIPLLVAAVNYLTVLFIISAIFLSIFVLAIF